MISIGEEMNKQSARPSARMKLTKLPASRTALSNSAEPPLRTSIRTCRRCQISSGSMVMTRRADRQNDTSHAGRSIRRTITPAVLKAVAATTANSTPSRAELGGAVDVFIEAKM